MSLWAGFEIRVLSTFFKPPVAMRFFNP